MYGLHSPYHMRTQCPPYGHFGPNYYMDLFIWEPPPPPMNRLAGGNNSYRVQNRFRLAGWDALGLR